MGKVRGLRTRVHQAAVRPTGAAAPVPAPPVQEAAPPQTSAGGVRGKEWALVDTDLFARTKIDPSALVQKLDLDTRGVPFSRRAQYPRGPSMDSVYMFLRALQKQLAYNATVTPKQTSSNVSPDESQCAPLLTAASELLCENPGVNRCRGEGCFAQEGETEAETREVAAENRSHKAGRAEAPGRAEAAGHRGGGGPAAPVGRPP
ncbi:ribosome biogenesis protein SLX9 homolog isoform 3-T6 [Hipposideros larvatus]